MIPGVTVPPVGVKVLVATKPVDFRKGMDGLAKLVTDEMKADPFSGVVYVFRSKRGNRPVMAAGQRGDHAQGRS